MHALLLGLLLAAGPAATGSPTKTAPKNAPAKAPPDPGVAVKPFRVKVVNDYAESAFTVSYSITYADGTKPAKATLAKGLHITASSSEKLAGDVPVAHENDKVRITISATSLGDTVTWDFDLDLKVKLRTFIITYDYDTAEAKFRVKSRWGIL